MQSTGNVLDTPTGPRGKGPNAAEILPEILGLIGGIPAEDLAIFKDRLEKRRQTVQRSEYHEIILARVYPQPGQPVPELPGGKYETYLLTAAKHFRVEKKDLEAARKQHEEACDRARKLQHPLPEFPEIRQREYRSGDPITPQDDGEALMMLQDPQKFRPSKVEQDRIAELLAEQNRLKQVEADKDTEIAALKAQLAEMEKGRRNGGGK